MNSVYIEKKGNVGYLVLNRSEAMNTFNDVMSDELPQCVFDLKSDNAIRLVVMRGNGPAFMAGGDINMMYQGLDQMPGDIPRLADQLHQAIEGLYTMQKPVLACVHGAVAGAGLSLMLAADLVIAEKKTIFNLAYTHLGTSPDGGATYALPRHLGTKLTMQLMLLSERFDTNLALQYGLINWAVDKNELEHKLAGVIKKLENGPTLAYGKIKSLVNQSLQNSLSKQLNLEAEYFVKSTTTQDFKQGVTSFVSKTTAEFTGC